MEKPAKSTEESISELQAEIKVIEGRISANIRELEGAEEKLKEAMRQLELIEPREREVREERQGLLANGKEIKEATKTLRDIREKRELLEDEIAGLEKKISNLRAEGESLPGKKRQHEMHLRGTMLIPLVTRYNQDAEKMAKTLKEIYGIVWKLDEPKRFIFPSSLSWEGSLELIPRLYSRLDRHPNERGENFFRVLDFMDEYRKVEKEIAEK